MAPGREATEFNAIIQADRAKKQKQALADKIFSRRSSAPAAGQLAGGRKPPSGPSSLASRITKPGQQIPSRPKNSTPLQRVQQSASLKHSTSNPQLTNQNNVRRNQALDTAINNRGPSNPQIINSFSIRNNSSLRNGASSGPGFTIKGSAKRDYIVMASNFAPGTTAEDIGSVFAPGPDAGLVQCQITSASPTVTAELIFDNQNGADAVVQKYNGKKADNRVLHVYHHDGPAFVPVQPRAATSFAQRVGGSVPISSDDYMEVEREVPRQPRYQQPYTPPRSQRAEPEVQDGRYGFSDNNVYPPHEGTRQHSGLVSDGMIARNGNVRGRGAGRLFH